MVRCNGHSLRRRPLGLTGPTHVAVQCIPKSLLLVTLRGKLFTQPLRLVLGMVAFAISMRKVISSVVSLVVVLLLLLMLPVVVDLGV